MSSLNLQVFIAFEFTLNGNDVLGVTDLAIVRLLEILLELVELGAQGLPFVPDREQLGRGFCLRFKIVLPNEILKLLGLA